MSVLDKIKKNSSIKDAAILAESKFFTEKDMVSTAVPAMNIALGGSLDGGITPGLNTWAGPSKHFKTGLCLLMAMAYMKKYPEAVLLFYDSEFGTPQSYFKSFDIDMHRVWHTPIKNIEEFKFDLMQQLENLDRGDKVIIIVDSVGNLASKKEVDDAIDKKSVADMTRAKALKSLYRMITPYLVMLDIPMHQVNHTYKTHEMFAKDVMSGGQGPYLSSDNIYFVGRQQDKDKKTNEIRGYNFIVTIEKSRHVKEKSKIPLEVLFEGGINKWSGLMDMALESGHVVKPKQGWYAKVDQETGEISDKNFRLADTNSKEFWNSILEDQKFKDYVTKKYRLVSENSILEDDE